MSLMHRPSPRRAAGLALALLASCAAVFAQDAPAAGQKAEEAYMNIQVLKGTPADQVIPAMQFISSALNVDCEYCHVRGAFEKDDLKPKQTARKMIQMMGAINATHFDGHREVTCFTCHHGAAEAASIPAIPETETKPHEPPAKPPTLPAPAQLLDKYAAAVGGADALAKIASRVQKGTMAGFGGRTFPVEIFAKAPAKRASYVHTPQGDSITAFDGQAGWLGNPGRPPRDMSAAEADGARMDADLRFATSVKQAFTEFDVQPSDKIGAHDVLLVTAKKSGQPPVRLYFDKDSGLLVRMVRYIDTPLGRNPTQIDYDDYRESDGVKVPFKWTVARPQGRFTITLDESKNNVPVDDAKFAKPAPVPPKPETPGGGK